jgi:hypothetical protein
MKGFGFVLSVGTKLDKSKKFKNSYLDFIPKNDYNQTQSGARLHRVPTYFFKPNKAF